MIEVLAQAADQATELTKHSEGITGSIQGALGCLGLQLVLGLLE